MTFEPSRDGTLRQAHERAVRRKIRAAFKLRRGELGAVNARVADVGSSLGVSADPVASANALRWELPTGALDTGYSLGQVTLDQVYGSAVLELYVYGRNERPIGVATLVDQPDGFNVYPLGITYLPLETWRGLASYSSAGWGAYAVRELEQEALAIAEADARATA